MKTRKRVILGSLVLLTAFVVFAMLTVNLRVAMSTTNTNSTVSASNAFSHGQTIDLEGATRKICFHVNERVGLASTLSWEIREALRAAKRFEIYLLNNEPEKDDHPLLLVEIENPKILWTPVYGHATLDVKFVYATDTTDPAILQGNSDNLEPDSDPDKFQLRVRGTITISDSTKGLVTLPAYREHLTKDAAKAIVEGIVKAIDDLKKDIEKQEQKQGE
ncbi:MAG: hypothetical protein K1Y02_14285 [Candidatus Hydrogenedentes bacterium]|nr:hypothetical protein [Candidatus Hydrogenedentota bacterium]